MKEIEVKILKIDKNKTIKNIISLGGILTYDGDIETVTYKSKDKAPNVVRLRKTPVSCELAVKEKVDKTDVKIMDEHEVVVSDFETTRDILKKIGLKEKMFFKKHRTAYALGKIKFDIDTIQGIPTFMEIEAPSKELVFEYVEKLGFKKEDAKAWTLKDLMKHYRVKIN